MFIYYRPTYLFKKFEPTSLVCNDWVCIDNLKRYPQVRANVHSNFPLDVVIDKSTKFIQDLNARDVYITSNKLRLKCNQKNFTYYVNCSCCKFRLWTGKMWCMLKSNCHWDHLGLNPYNIRKVLVEHNNYRYVSS